MAASKTSLAVPRASVGHVLTRILEEPALVAEVRSLPPAALTRLIDHIGLEDAGEIVALATTEQIASVFDEDLWTREAPGADDTFDAQRFVVWLEILLEAGERVAAKRLAELDPDTVTFALHNLAHVVVTDDLGVDDELEDIEKVLESALTQEIGEYMLIARRHDGWDAIVQALVALDEVDHDACSRLLDRLTALTERAADDEGGLYEVLSDAESLADDVAGDRNERRAKDGFIAASDARAFLRLAKEHDAPKAGERDAVTKAYFRELDKSPRPKVKPSRLLSMLDRAGVTREKKPKALGRSLLTDAMSALAPERQAELMEELAYLVNVLIAGDKRHWRPADAAEAVVAVIEAGIQAKDLTRESLVNAFRAGVRAGKLDAIAKLREE